MERRQRAQCSDFWGRLFGATRGMKKGRRYIAEEFCQP